MVYLYILMIRDNFNPLFMTSFEINIIEIEKEKKSFIPQILDSRIDKINFDCSFLYSFFQETHLNIFI